MCGDARTLPGAGRAAATSRSRRDDPRRLRGCALEYDAEAIAAIRRAEAKAAGDLIGAEYHCLEFRDLAIFEDDESRRRVVEFLRRSRPDIILTAPPADYLCDHEATHRLVRDACFIAPVPNYVTRQWEPAPRLGRIPHLYFVDALEGAHDREGRPHPVDFYAST